MPKTAFVSLTYNASISVGYALPIPEDLQPSEADEWARSNYVDGEQVHYEEINNSDVVVDSVEIHEAALPVVCVLKAIAGDGKGGATSVFSVDLTHGADDISDDDYKKAREAAVASYAWAFGGEPEAVVVMTEDAK